MKLSAAKSLYWAPRILCMLFIPFLMLFSLDVFDEASGFKEVLIGLLMHNIPVFILIIILGVSWRYEWVGAVLFNALGFFYIWWAWGKFDIYAYLFISGPLFLIGLLFLTGWIKRSDIRPRRIQPASSVLAVIMVSVLMSGCASFRSQLESGYKGEVKRNPDARPVSVLFVFSHVRQTIGYDAVPKLQPKRNALGGFDDIFSDALREISNVGTYAAHTEEAEDVNRPERRTKRDSLMQVSDYTIKIRIESKKYMVGHFLGTLFSAVTAVVVPIPYTYYYSMQTEVLDQNRNLLASYHREARLTKWVEALLIFAYPFHPEERKREEIYMDFLHDTFRQIESEGVLKAK